MSDSANHKLPDRLLNVFVALFTFFIAILVAVIAGDYLGFLVREYKDKPIPFLRVSLGLGTGALALTVLVSTAKDVLTVLANLPTYFRELKSLPILQDALKIFCAIAALMLAVRTLGPTDIQPTTPADSALIAAVSFDDPEPLVVFPILYAENGARDTDRKTATATGEPKATWTKGVKVDSDRVKEIVELLASCKQESRPYSIELQVAGFASSKEFGTPKTDTDADDSDAANVELANLRTQNTVDEINTRLKTLSLVDSFWVTAHPDWTSYEAMVGARPVLDRFVNAKRTELENWTRRVDVRVLRAGNCTRRDILEKTNIVRRAAGADSTATIVKR